MMDIGSSAKKNPVHIGVIIQPRDYAWEEIDRDSRGWDSDEWEADYERRVAEWHIEDNPWELCRVS